MSEWFFAMVWDFIAGWIDLAIAAVFFALFLVVGVAAPAAAILVLLVALEVNGIGPLATTSVTLLAVLAWFRYWFLGSMRALDRACRWCWIPMWRETFGEGSR